MDDKMLRRLDVDPSILEHPLHRFFSDGNHQQRGIAGNRCEKRERRQIEIPIGIFTQHPGHRTRNNRLGQDVVRVLRIHTLEINEHYSLPLTAASGVRSRMSHKIISSACNIRNGTATITSPPQLSQLNMAPADSAAVAWEPKTIMSFRP